ncbi:MAG: hypothetical protein WCL51_03540 [Bacteroidota bacterium]
MNALKVMLIGVVMFLACTIQAQVSVNLNIGTPPRWGPVGYNDVKYYYIPDVEAYYDINASMFIYQSGGIWIHRTYLPRRYRNYDLYGGYKVVLNNYHGNSPYDNFNDHRNKYAKGYHDRSQKTYGERPGRGNHKVNMGPKDHRNKRENPGIGRNERHDQFNKGNKDHGNNGNKDHGNKGNKDHGYNGKNGKRN